jgi:hypothetical protein
MRRLDVAPETNESRETGQTPFEEVCSGIARAGIGRELPSKWIYVKNHFSSNATQQSWHRFGSVLLTDWASRFILIVRNCDDKPLGKAAGLLAAGRIKTLCLSSSLFRRIRVRGEARQHDSTRTCVKQLL